MRAMRLRLERRDRQNDVLCCISAFCEFPMRHIRNFHCSKFGNSNAANSDNRRLPKPFSHGGTEPRRRGAFGAEPLKPARRRAVCDGLWCGFASGLVNKFPVRRQSRTAPHWAIFAVAGHGRPLRGTQKITEIRPSKLSNFQTFEPSNPPTLPLSHSPTISLFSVQAEGRFRVGRSPLPCPLYEAAMPRIASARDGVGHARMGRRCPWPARPPLVASLYSGFSVRAQALNSPTPTPTLHYALSTTHFSTFQPFNLSTFQPHFGVGRTPCDFSTRT